MKARKPRFLTMLFALILLIGSLPVLLTSCEVETAKFTFTVSDGLIQDTESSWERIATVKVVTTCDGGWLFIPQNSGYASGGQPMLVLSDGTTVRGYFEDAKLITTVNIREGASVEQSWLFNVPEDFSEGAYTVTVMWYDSAQTFEDVPFAMAE